MTLAEIAETLVGRGKGILAMDESIATCNKRLASVGLSGTEALRRAWRDLIVTTPNLGSCISGAILADETIRQTTLDGRPFVRALDEAGIIVGIKVDLGAKDMAGFPGEKITEGLDGLRDRLAEYAVLGARFAKWRAVITIGDGLPSRGCIEANAHALARYAALVQEAGLVPIVEPELLMTGSHTLEQCAAATEAVLSSVFEQLATGRVVLDGMILKPNMVLPGLDAAEQDPEDVVARATIACLLHVVPAEVAGIAFLSGGQSGELASARLAAINAIAAARYTRVPWPLTFSFARAIQWPALQIWAGRDANLARAQVALLKRANCNRAALVGDYDQAMELRSA
ncbi:MAG: fructose-bisphosphate aldolase class I [Ancalomicrobiaceae bacterium]|nr:fructose-bisphosphate aldolase class I [Ancalomicrobiaceae bacterium]